MHVAAHHRMRLPFTTVSAPRHSSRRGHVLHVTGRWEASMNCFLNEGGMHFLRHSTFAAHLLPFLSHAKEAGRAGQEAVGGARFSR
eukprot:COSAG06_NODE_50740_length_316_cov_1.188940_1_plen_85_part_01